jgi:hypothetical protein
LFTGEPNNYDLYLEGVTELLKHITVYAQQCAKDSNETALLLRKFSDTLISDRTLFKADKVMLEELKHESEKTFYQTVAKLSKMDANAGAYKEAIKAAMAKIEQWQKEVNNI